MEQKSEDTSHEIIKSLDIILEDIKDFEGFMKIHKDDSNITLIHLTFEKNSEMKEGSKDYHNFSLEKRATEKIKNKQMEQIQNVFDGEKLGEWLKKNELNENVEESKKFIQIWKENFDSLLEINDNIFTLIQQKRKEKKKILLFLTTNRESFSCSEDEMLSRKILIYSLLFICCFLLFRRRLIPFNSSIFLIYNKFSKMNERKHNFYDLSSNQKFNSILLPLIKQNHLFNVSLHFLLKKSFHFLTEKNLFFTICPLKHSQTSSKAVRKLSKSDNIVRYKPPQEESKKKTSFLSKLKFWKKSEKTDDRLTQSTTNLNNFQVKDRRIFRFFDKKKSKNSPPNPSLRISNKNNSPIFENGIGEEEKKKKRNNSLLPNSFIHSDSPISSKKDEKEMYNREIRSSSVQHIYQDDLLLTSDPFSPLKSKENYSMNREETPSSLTPVLSKKQIEQEDNLHLAPPSSQNKLNQKHPSRSTSTKIRVVINQNYEEIDLKAVSSCDWYHQISKEGKEIIKKVTSLLPKSNPTLSHHHLFLLLNIVHFFSHETFIVIVPSLNLERLTSSNRVSSLYSFSHYQFLQRIFLF